MRVKWMMLAVAFISLSVEAVFPEQSPSKNDFTFIAVEIAENTNIWLPSTLVVKKGETVHLLLRNVSEREHGFTIEALGVKEVIPPDGKIRVKIHAVPEGVYRLYCQLHKAHIGGQILVQ